MLDDGTAMGPLEAVLAQEHLTCGVGQVTVLVAPHGAGCAEFAAHLSDPVHGYGVRTVTLDDEGTGRFEGGELPAGDDEAWAAFAKSSVEAGDVVLVIGTLAEAVSASIWFTPAISLTDGGSVEEARLRLSAIAMKSRLVGGFRGGDFEAVFGRSDVPDHAALSALVGRIAGYAWDLDTGGMVADRVILYPDGLDNMSQMFLLRPATEESAPDASSPGDAEGSDEASGAAEADVAGDAGAAAGVDDVPGDPGASGRPLGDLHDRLTALRRSAFLPVLAPPGTPAVGVGSRSFGFAFVPAGTTWPRAANGPLALVMQLDLASLPADAQSLLGSAGTFQFFLDLNDPPTDGTGGGFLARIVDHATPGAYLPSPTESDTETRIPRVVVGWREVEEAPHGTEFSEGSLREFAFDEREAGVLNALEPNDARADRLSTQSVARAAKALGLVPGEADAVAEALSHQGSDKLLGWPSWTQGAEWPTSADGRPMTLLFQFQMEESLNPGGEFAPNLIASDGTAHVFVTAEGEPEFSFGWACG